MRVLEASEEESGIEACEIYSRRQAGNFIMADSSDTIEYTLIVIYIVAFALTITGNFMIILLGVYHRRKIYAYKLFIGHLI